MLVTLSDEDMKSDGKPWSSDLHYTFIDRGFCVVDYSSFVSLMAEKKLLKSAWPFEKDLLNKRISHKEFKDLQEAKKENDIPLSSFGYCDTYGEVIDFFPVLETSKRPLVVTLQQHRNVITNYEYLGRKQGMVLDQAWYYHIVELDGNKF